MRKLMYAAVYLFLVSDVFAQSAPQEFTLKLSLPEVQTVGKALEKMPYAEVAPLFAKLQAQITQQQQPTTQPVEQKPVEKKE